MARDAGRGGAGAPPEPVPGPDRVVADLAELLGVEPRRLRACLGPYPGPEVLLSGTGVPGLEGLPRRAARRLELLLRLFPAWSAAQPRPRAIQTPDDVARHMGRFLSRRRFESFWALGLDVRSRPLATLEVARGTLSACLVHPRELFAPLMQLRAASAVLVHNHPSGDPRPSPEDVQLTRRMIDAGELVGVPVLDHVIIADGDHRSLLDEGHFAPASGPARAGSPPRGAGVGSG